LRSLLARWRVGELAYWEVEKFGGRDCQILPIGQPLSIKANIQYPSPKIKYRQNPIISHNITNHQSPTTTIMSTRTNYASGAKWEDIVGYSRAVKVGNIIEVSGTTAVEDRHVVGKGDAYAQTRFILEKIEKVLKDAGATMENVVRTRLFVTDISRWEEVGRAHGEFFRHIKPASTMVEVSALIEPEILVEIEVTAVV
jgi:enamine deaminase RidA (YjgF/YER057c/UK114 family)